MTYPSGSFRFRGHCTTSVWSSITTQRLDFTGQAGAKDYFILDDLIQSTRFWTKEIGIRGANMKRSRLLLKSRPGKVHSARSSPFPSKSPSTLSLVLCMSNNTRTMDALTSFDKNSFIVFTLSWTNNVS